MIDIFTIYYWFTYKTYINKNYILIFFLKINHVIIQNHYTNQINVCDYFVYVHRSEKLSVLSFKFLKSFGERHKYVNLLP